jgi:hypothetical protein
VPIVLLGEEHPKEKAQQGTPKKQNSMARSTWNKNHKEHLETSNNTTRSTH